MFSLSYLTETDSQEGFRTSQIVFFSAAEVSFFPQVLEVEEEMRQLLQETQTSKRAMEEKVRRLSSVLKDFHS